MMSASFRISITFFALLLCVILPAARADFKGRKFNELFATDLKSKNVSFDRYDDKLILLYELSPIFRNPEQQVKCLNAFYDKYHDRGLEIIGVSGAKTLLKVFDRRFYKFNFKFDMYSHKYAHKNINEFLSVQPFTKLDHKHIFFVLQDMKTFLSIPVHKPLCDPNTDYLLNGLHYDIEYYLSHHRHKTTTAKF